MIDRARPYDTSGAPRFGMQVSADSSVFARMSGSTFRDLNLEATRRPSKGGAGWERSLEATVGIEPTIGVLQTPALTTWSRRHKKMERKTRFELATPSLARRCSTTEPLPLPPFGMRFWHMRLKSVKAGAVLYFTAEEPGLDLRRSIARFTTPFVCAALLALTAVPAPRGVAASGLPAVGAPPNLTLSASPQLVDVGQDEVFTLTASSWPASASATLSFVSPHHGFTGQMVWEPQCGCFEIAVHLAARVHPFEQATATATVRYARQRQAFATHAGFSIRGLAPGGKTLAPGGTPGLRAWVTDPSPPAGQQEDFCAWVTTPDGLGVAGLKVQFVVHFPGKTVRLSPGKTPTSGLICSHRAVPSNAAGHVVRVDVTVANLKSNTTLKVRS